jgi:predicted transcriptional regulator
MKKRTPELGLRNLFPNMPDISSRPARSVTSKHLEELLHECQITAEELANLIGCNPSVVSRHINGHMNPRLKALREYDYAFTKLLKRNIVVKRNGTKRNLTEP